VWVVLPRIAPEFTEWAEFFAATARKRSAAEAGLPCVLSREADDLVREADAFVARIAHTLDLPYQPALTGTLLPVG
jgi:hypothetical protein